MHPLIARRMPGGLEVSAIGLGAPIYAEPSASAVIPNLHRALDREVALVDSSDIYWHGMHEEFVGVLLDVLQDFRLGGVPLRPPPFLLEVVRERVRVIHALDVAARARVALPVPRAAAAGLVGPGPEPEPAEAMEHVEPREPDGDRHGILANRRLIEVASTAVL